MILRFSILAIFILLCSPPLVAQTTKCTNGKAGDYPCASVDLQAFLPITEMGGTSRTDANDIWGWTDPASGKEYALIGLSTGTAFVDISTPTEPVYLGSLATHTSSSSWRDIKVYNGHAYIVSEASEHGMQVFDLSQLANANPPTTFTETAHYDRFGRAHNIVINEDSGFAYAVGAGTCSGGLEMIDISTPTKPSFAGCFSDDGYTHDAQCVMYTGDDPDYQNREICINSNEDSITVVDVTDKNSPVQISKEGYPDSDYVHQGWLSEDQRYFFQNDELDESGTNTRTIIWDLKDLDDPFVAEQYFGETKAIDHNLYVKGDFVYESNYSAGLRILDASDPENLNEVAFFDTYPSNDAASFNGAWSSYPYFESGNVIISGIGEGLFIVKPNLGELPVDLVAFDAILDGSDVVLRWETASETNNAGFDVEQLNGEGYTKIGFVDGQGTTDVAQQYAFAVSNLGPGQHAFRLKQIDFDGAFEYSETASVSIDAPASLAISKAYPNPFNPVTLINVSVARSQQIRVEAYNYQGQRVGLLFDGTLEANLEKELRFDAGNLPSGSYLIRATGEHEIVTQSVTLVK
ncbi:MAG: choice-of-anchor B family protein [Rhodothermales bacterium]